MNSIGAKSPDPFYLIGICNRDEVMTAEGHALDNHVRCLFEDNTSLSLEGLGEEHNGGEEKDDERIYDE